MGIPAAFAADFAAGTVGSALEQKITTGDVDLRKSVTSGLTNAVSNVIYGNGPLKSVKSALARGAGAGAATAAINNISDALAAQTSSGGGGKRRDSSGGTALGTSIPYGKSNDPRTACGSPEPFKFSVGYQTARGYQYSAALSSGSGGKTKKKGFSLGDFLKDVAIGAVTGGLASVTFYGAGKAVDALKGSVSGGRSGSLNEETFTRYMSDGRQVTDVKNLPGSDGIKISKRLTTDEMTFLTQEYGVEFAQVYKYGNGVNGGGGQYYLYSGTVNRVTVPIKTNMVLINHTHPGGTAYPSLSDKDLLRRLQQLGSPQRSSEIIPIGKEIVRFNTSGVIRGE